MKSREEEIVRTLANDVRVLSLQQVARTWWTDTRSGRSRAKQAMLRLELDGWVQLHRSLARPVVEPRTPLVRWSPGDLAADMWSLSRTLHQRACEAASMTDFVLANAKGVALFARGPAPSVKLTQMTHDLQVAEVYLRYRAEGVPNLHWRSEDRLPAEWPLRQRPDAVLVDDGGVIRRAIEYGGDYAPSRLTELHDVFSSLDLCYEIW